MASEAEPDVTRKRDAARRYNDEVAADAAKTRLMLGLIAIAFLLLGLGLTLVQLFVFAFAASAVLVRLRACDHAAYKCRFPVPQVSVRV